LSNCSCGYTHFESVISRVADATVRHHDVALAAALVVTSLLVFAPALGVYPTFVDNVASLSVAERDSLVSLWQGPVFSFQPTYRPVPFSTLWLQGQIADFHIWTYHLVNVVIWTACGWLVYLLVRPIVGFRLIALVVALAVLFDERAEWNLWVILERQTSLAVLTGVSALLLTLRLASYRRQRLVLACIGVLLLLSALSIEYGLAFSAAVFTAGLVAKPRMRRLVLGVSLAAVVAYAGLRLGLARGTSRDFCESMGYFTQLRPDPTCLSSLSTEARVKQHLYNLGASLVGIVFPSLFSFDGVWEPYARERYKLVASFVILALALFGLARRPSATVPFLTLWVANAVLGFYLYRSRNQVVGMIGIYASAGIGAAELVRLMLARPPYLRQAALALSLVAGVWIAFVGLDASHRLMDVRQRERNVDPCLALERYPDDASVEVVRRIERAFDLGDGECAR
jgi:hypothetical protein